jgi:hypothetical protein
VIEVVSLGESAELAQARASDLDVLVVSLDSRFPGFDRFAPVIELQRFASRTRAASEPGPMVLGLSVAESNPLLPLRAAEAAVDHLYWWDQLDSIQTLEQMVLAPEAETQPRSIPTLASLRRIGVTTNSTLNAGLDWISDNGLAWAFAGTCEGTLSRRRRITVRERLTAVMKAHCSDGRSQSSQARTLPSWQQLSALVDLARGASDQWSLHR